MTMPGLELFLRVGLATLLGIAIGVERQWRARMAGLQTMALVSMGAALFLILGAYTFHREQDPTRVAAQIVTGIGFLGAGVIMKQGSSVTGTEHRGNAVGDGGGGRVGGRVDVARGDCRRRNHHRRKHLPISAGGTNGSRPVENRP